MGGDNPSLSKLEEGAGFNPHPRVGGDGDEFFTLGGETFSFNPHPRVGGDPDFPLDMEADKVSIHTPAWGVTSARPSVLPPRCCFNPHPRVGGDRG